MFDRSRRYASYAAQKKQRNRILWVLLVFVVFFVVYTALTSLVFSFIVLDNETMQPGLLRGDRFIFSSYRVYSFFSGSDISGMLHRGNIVLVDKSLVEKQSFFPFALDSIIRFFTAQRLGIQGGEDKFIKRVIGFPGDEISMNNFVVRVGPRGELYSFTEFELWDRPYESIVPPIPALWDETLPFSGNMETLILSHNEFFVLSDDRSNTNDSRTWGPIPISMISGKALFRYWPFLRLGIP